MPQRQITKEVGRKIENVLNAIFEDPESPFAKLPPEVYLVCSWIMTRQADGMYEFRLGTDEKIRPMRPYHDRYVELFTTDKSAMLGFFDVSKPEKDCMTGSYYHADTMKMVRDIVTFLFK